MAIRKYKIVHDLDRNRYAIYSSLIFLPYWMYTDYYISHDEFEVNWHGALAWGKRFDSYEEAKAIFDVVIKPRKKRFVTLLKHP